MPRKRKPEPKLWHVTDLPVYPYLDCRAMRHKWNLVSSGHWDPAWGVGITQVCMSCGMEKRQMIMKRNGRSLGKPRYLQPENYRFAKGERPQAIDIWEVILDAEARKHTTKRVRMSKTVPHA